MIKPLKIATCNAKAKHSQKITSFIFNQNIDILLISETYFTNNHYCRIPGNTVYQTMHPDGKAHRGTVLIIRSDIKHYEIGKFQREFFL